MKINSYAMTFEDCSGNVRREIGMAHSAEDMRKAAEKGRELAGGKYRIAKIEKI